MSAAKNAILARIRLAKGLEGDAARAEGQALAERAIAAKGPYLIPARAQLGADERRTLFIAKALEVSAVVLPLAKKADIPAAVRKVMEEQGLEKRLALSPNPWFEGLDWPGVETYKGSPRPDDYCGLALAFAGVAETGTLMLASSASNPTLMNFMPDLHFVALPESRILGTYEDGFALLRRETNAMPRAVNLVTGPSRTGDIEQTILLGAHGPRKLVILLVEE